VPAKNFWSVVLYDPQTRSELQTPQPYPSKNDKRDKLLTNADGSVDLYFGPKAPAGKEANWTQSVPGKGWFAVLRLHGPPRPLVRQEVEARRGRGGEVARQQRSHRSIWIRQIDQITPDVK